MMTTLFFAVWAALVAGVVAAIVHQDRFFAVDNKAIATLERKSGNVQVRSEGLVRWTDTVEKQGFFDGDRVSTARGSKAKVGFGPSRALVLGEETQVQITAILQGNGEYAFLITLLRGSMVAEVAGACKGCPPLVIRAGDDTFNVGSGVKLALVKELGKKVVKFNPKGPWPVVKHKPVAVIPQTFLEAPAAPEPPPPPPPPPAVKAEGYEVQVRAPAAGLVYYTVQPLGALASVSIDFPLTPPPERPKNGEWRPIVQIAGANPKATEVAQTAGPNDLTVKIPVTKARQLASVNQKSGYKEYSFSVRGGAQVTPLRGFKRTPVQSFGESKVDVKIRSYGEFSGGPVSIGLDKFTAVQDNLPWTQAKGELSLEAAPFAVHMVTGQDYFKFLPFLKGANAIGISRSGLASNDGTFVVRNQAVIAQLRGSAMDQHTIETLLPLLDGNFVFKGPRSALYDMRGTSQTALLDWIGALLDKGKVLYILKRNKLYPVSRDFIKTNSEVAKFIDSQAKAVFLEKVEILDYR